MSVGVENDSWVDSLRRNRGSLIPPNESGNEYSECFDDVKEFGK